MKFFAETLGSPSGLGLPNVSIDAGIQTIVGTVFLGVGVISIIMVIVGGLQYTLSAGDPSSTKRAKDTILYSIIGLIVSVVAFGIVSFVTGRLG